VKTGPVSPALASPVNKSAALGSRHSSSAPYTGAEGRRPRSAISPDRLRTWVPSASIGRQGATSVLVEQRHDAGEKNVRPLRRSDLRVLSWHRRKFCVGSDRDHRSAPRRAGVLALNELHRPYTFEQMFEFGDLRDVWPLSDRSLWMSATSAAVRVVSRTARISKVGEHARLGQLALPRSTNICSSE